jgi:excisionase family DNA binding protein
VTAIAYAAAPTIVGDRTADGRAAISCDEMAALTGVSRTAIFDACREGRIGCVRVGRRVLIPIHVVRGLLLDGILASS